jgi:hypothetical protein
MGGTSPIIRSRGNAVLLHTRGTGGIIPLQNVTILCFALIFSLLFIIALSCAFLGADAEDVPPFKTMLDDIATNDPGVGISYVFDTFFLNLCIGCPVG